MFGAEEGDPADPHQAAARHKQLVFELNKNGQYLRLKEQLKAAVIGIVKDSYHKSGGMGREEMQASLCLASHLFSCQRVQEITCWSMSCLSIHVLQIRNQITSCVLHSVCLLTLHKEILFTEWSPFCQPLLQVVHLCNGLTGSETSPQFQLRISTVPRGF